MRPSGFTPPVRHSFRAGMARRYRVLSVALRHFLEAPAWLDLERKRKTSMLTPAPADRDENATADASRKVAGDTESEYSERRRILLTTWAILIALALVVVLLRLQRLDEVPAGLNRDEGIDGALALRVLKGEHAVFFPVDQRREPSAIYALALSTSLLGRNLLAMRLPTALGSAAMVIGLFWMGRLLFGRGEGGQATPWRGLLIGGAGAGLMAVSLSQTIIGRTSYNKITHMPLLLILCISLLWWGWNSTGSRLPSDGLDADGKQIWWRVALAGVCAGLLPYTYLPARFTPFLFLLFGISFLLPWGGLSDRREMGGEQSRLPRRALLASQLRLALPRVYLFAGVAGLVAAPILIHFALHPEHFLMRSRAVWLLREDEASLFAAFLANAWDHLLAFGWRGDAYAMGGPSVGDGGGAGCRQCGIVSLVQHRGRRRIPIHLKTQLYGNRITRAPEAEGSQCHSTRWFNSISRPTSRSATMICGCSSIMPPRWNRFTCQG